MGPFTFRVDDLNGCASTAHRRTSKKYARWKENVRNIANVAGVPQVPSDRQRVHVEIRWRGAARKDGKNVLAAIEDALFAQDRACAAGSWVRFTDTGEDCALVTVDETSAADRPERTPERPRVTDPYDRRSFRRFVDAR